MIKEDLIETATVFTRGQPDVFGGATWTKKEIKVRWEKRNSIFYDENGRIVRSDSRVFMQDDVSPGDYLYKGTTTETDPVNLEEAKQVITVKDIYSLDGTEKLVVAYL